MTDDRTANGAKSQSGRLTVSIGGNVGPGTAIGQNATVRANNIAGRDIRDVQNNNAVAGKTREDFVTLLDDLREMIVKARDAGELDEAAANQALENVEAAAELVSQEKPPKRPLLRKLEDVADLLDGAAETVEATGGVARVILKAIPVAALLLKLASYLF